MNVLTKSDVQCCGCKVCGDICPVGAISFSDNEDGFIYPFVDEGKCLSCGKCVEVCPFHNVPNGMLPKQVYAASNNDYEVLQNSSSGGMFAPFADYQIKRKGLIVGCIFDDTHKVKHIISDSKDELLKMQKSKYVQSDLAGIYSGIKNLLDQGKSVLFSGTPCEVAALKNLLKDSDCTNLLLIDIVCHGTPSQKLFDEYLCHYEKKTKNKVKRYMFRVKRAPNDGMNCFVSIRSDRDSEKVLNWPMDSYNYYFMKGVINRPSCYLCPYCSKQRQGDITLCDFWGWENYHHEFDFGTQVSGVMLNTEKGINAFEDVCNSYSIRRVPSSIDNIAKHNGCLTKPTPLPVENKEVFSIYKDQGYDGVDRYFKRNNWKVICKYTIMMHIPRNILLAILRRRYEN